MEVTNIRVSFMREKQPVQYEKAQPMVELAGTLADGENHLTAARNLMLDAASIVYAGIGYSVPEKVADALMNIAPGTTMIEAAQATAKVEVEFANKLAAEEKGTAKDEVEKPAAKKRGRPKGSSNKKTTEAEVQKLIDDTKAAAKATEDEIAAAGGAYDGPDDNISNGDEDRVDPNASDEEFTPKDLHDLIIGHVKSEPRTLSVANARSILAHFKVVRAQDLTNDQASEGKIMVEQMVKEEAAA